MAMHRVGDLVWAKMKGYPPWPAMVLSSSDIPQTCPVGKTPVLFYGTNETAVMKPGDLFSYMAHRAKYEMPRRVKHFNQAVREIRREAGIEEEPDFQTRFPISAFKSPAVVSKPPILTKETPMQEDPGELSDTSSVGSRTLKIVEEVEETPKSAPAASSSTPSEETPAPKERKVPKLKIALGKPHKPSESTPKVPKARKSIPKPSPPKPTPKSPTMTMKISSIAPLTLPVHPPYSPPVEVSRSGRERKIKSFGGDFVSFDMPKRMQSPNVKIGSPFPAESFKSQEHGYTDVSLVEPKEKDDRGMLVVSQKKRKSYTEVSLPIKKIKLAETEEKEKLKAEKAKAATGPVPPPIDTDDPTTKKCSLCGGKVRATWQTNYNRRKWRCTTKDCRRWFHWADDVESSPSVTAKAAPATVSEKKLKKGRPKKKQEKTVTEPEPVPKKAPSTETEPVQLETASEPTPNLQIPAPAESTEESAPPLLEAQAVPEAEPTEKQPELPDLEQNVSPIREQFFEETIEAVPEPKAPSPVCEAVFEETIESIEPKTEPVTSPKPLSEFVGSPKPAKRRHTDSLNLESDVGSPVEEGDRRTSKRERKPKNFGDDFIGIGRELKAAITIPKGYLGRSTAVVASPPRPKLSSPVRSPKQTAADSNAAGLDDFEEVEVRIEPVTQSPHRERLSSGPDSRPTKPCPSCGMGLCAIVTTKTKRKWRCRRPECRKYAGIVDSDEHPDEDRPRPSLKIKMKKLHKKKKHKRKEREQSPEPMDPSDPLYESDVSSGDESMISVPSSPEPSYKKAPKTPTFAKHKPMAKPRPDLKRQQLKKSLKTLKAQLTHKQTANVRKGRPPGPAVTATEMPIDTDDPKVKTCNECGGVVRSQLLAYHGRRKWRCTNSDCKKWFGWADIQGAEPTPGRGRPPKAPKTPKAKTTPNVVVERLDGGAEMSVSEEIEQFRQEIERQREYEEDDILNDLAAISGGPGKAKKAVKAHKKSHKRSGERHVRQDDDELDLDVVGLTDEQRKKDQLIEKQLKRKSRFSDNDFSDSSLSDSDSSFESVKSESPKPKKRGRPPKKKDGDKKAAIKFKLGRGRPAGNKSPRSPGFASINPFSPRASNRYDELPRSPSPLPDSALLYKPSYLEGKSRWWLQYNSRTRAPSPPRVFGLEALDCAAVFRLVGRNMEQMSERMKTRRYNHPGEDDSQGTLDGTLDLLMDTLMTSLGPLVTLTSVVPGMDVLNRDQLHDLWEATAIYTPIWQ